MEKNHLFFDLDNTLWDHRKNAQLTLEMLFKREELFEKYGLYFNDFYREYYTVNERLWELIRDGKITKEYLREHRFLDTFAVFDIIDPILAERFENQFLDEILQFNELVEGTSDLLEYLKEKGYTLHILSNGFKEVTQRKCQLSGIGSYFDSIVSADEVGHRKPHASCFQFAIEKAGCQVNSAVFIGDDWIADVLGASSFGMEAIFFDVFKDGYSAPGVRTIEHLSELKSIF